MRVKGSEGYSFHPVPLLLLLLLALQEKKSNLSTPTVYVCALFFIVIIYLTPCFYNTKETRSFH